VSTAAVTARESGVIAGLDAAEVVFAVLDGSVSFRRLVGDGDAVGAGQDIAQVAGPTRSLLACERTALNLLQRLSGIATTTRRYVELVSGTGARITDTRKTTPGLRALEKYAVTVGGGQNHRLGLFDGILIKDNHIAAAGLRQAVAAAKRGAPQTMRVEVEVRSLDELQEAIDAGADAVLLDNMEVDTLRQAVQIARGRVVLEASGGVNEGNVAAIAATGVDVISVGALTHSVKALDIGMDFRDT
jgi:nicotinate-nucleotide pyrophosphorylase (carboxylating)